MKNKYANLIAGIIIMVLAVVIFVASGFIKKIVSTSIGPDFAPKLTAILLAILSAILIIREIIKIRRANKASAMNTGIENSNSEKDDIHNEEAYEEETRIKRFIIKHVDYITLLLLVLFAISVPLLGFLFASIIYLFFQILVMQLRRKKKRIWMILIFSIVFSTAVYFIFVKFLHVILPAGLLNYILY